MEGSCLCGDHAFAVEGALQLMHHCHCGFCRKSHGSAFSTMAGVEAGRFRWLRRGGTGAFQSSPELARQFCTRCGSPLPVETADSLVFLQAALLEGDPGVRPQAHIFVASRASWFAIEDGLPTFDAYPPGFEAAVFDTRAPLDPEGLGVRGSCLCGRVRYVIDGEVITARHCHCSRCRRARGAAHASNLVVAAPAVRFTAGAEALSRYAVPEARFFAHTFCGGCGASMPHVDEGRDIAIVPMGGLDDPPPVTPREHIWVGSRAPWYEVPGPLPQRPEGPTA